MERRKQNGSLDSNKIEGDFMEFLKSNKRFSFLYDNKKFEELNFKT